MIAIFSFSCQTAGESGSLSDDIGRMLANAFVVGYPVMSADDQQWWVDMLTFPIRKTAHASEYFCLAVSLVMSCWQTFSLKEEKALGNWSFKDQLMRVCLVAFALTVTYACTDELHQLFIDGRSGQFTDVLVDASGAAIGCALCYLAMRRHFMRHPFQNV
jgi:VanZ family protein